eukprot:TRINITY_DN845_c0_g2_i1.p1 TRINITY_DN845_c0_g2~~TRINITY_DN845_c0_g2_i1.p1  ORF type:complete len:175 (-),score=34.58 TRINITY_DN845_c0_g2_i1:183-707(-)
MQMEVAVNSVGSVPGQDTMGNDETEGVPGDASEKSVTFKNSFKYSVVRYAQDWPMSRSEKLTRVLRLSELLGELEGPEVDTVAGKAPEAEGNEDNIKDVCEVPVAMPAGEFVLVHRSFLEALLTVQTPCSVSMQIPATEPNTADDADPADGDGGDGSTNPYAGAVVAADTATAP